MSFDDVLLNHVTSPEMVSNYDKFIGKLTLFSEPSSKLEQETADINILERPITPIEHEIKDGPASLDEFLELFRRRVCIDKLEKLSKQDQLSLLGIVEREICLVWPQLISLLDYPFFDDLQNREMRRSLFITVIIKCKDAFNSSKEKIQLYNNKNIFSDEANLVRMKLQLAEEVKNKLHIPSLRRHMYGNIAQGIQVEEPACCPVPSMEKLDKRFETEVHDNSRRETREHLPRPHIPFIPRKEDNKDRLKGHSGKYVIPVVSEQLEPQESSLPSIDDKRKYLETLNDKIQANKQDLCKLVAGEGEENPDDYSFANISQGTTTIEYYRSRNEKLREKIAIVMEQNKLKEQNETFHPREPLMQQPSSVPRYFRDRIYYVGDIRPTPRIKGCDISLVTNGPLWNELADEITPEIVKILDSNLSRGEEVKDIYKEMMKTVSHDHLSYTQDALFEKCPQKINLQEILSSFTLSSPLKKERIINNDLKSSTRAPWENMNQTRSEWEYPNYNLTTSTSNDIDLKHFVEISRDSNLHQKYLTGGSFGGSLPSGVNSSRDMKALSLDGLKEPVVSNRDTPFKMIAKRDYVISSEKFAQGLSKLPRLLQDRLVKQYDEWLTAWKKSFDPDDYIKFLSLQPTDFLSVIFHQFDSNSEDMDDLDQEYVSPEILEQRHKMKERAMERNTIVRNRIEELEKEKLQYTHGLWNPSTIFIGGLGKIPTISSDEITEILKDKPPLEDPDQRSSKMSAYSRARSAVSNGKRLPLFTKKGITKTESIQENQDLNKKISAIQTRLERIWSQLNMPNHIRLDMTIKYSSEVSLKCIDTVLQQWEIATRLVVERESALAELEKFERIASDPNRFFVKGYRGSSMARLEESKIRTEMQHILDEVTQKAKYALEDLKLICGDELTYGGRSYTEKIKWDRTEMLYWLQEERKEGCMRTSNNGLFIK